MSLNKESLEVTSKVSVIITVYNMERYLNQCIDSIVSQTFSDIEIICIDDGSTDRSADILHEYAQSDERIKVLTQGNKGAASARNLGIENASGEYLLIIDADDFYEPDTIEKTYLAAKERDADIVVFRSNFYNQNTSHYEDNTWSIMPEMLPHNPFSASDIPDKIFNIGAGWASDKLFKKPLIDAYQIRFQEIRTTNDMFFTYYAYVKASSIFVLEETLGHVRIHAHKSLSVTREKSWDNVYLALSALKEKLIEEKVYEKYRQSFVNWALNLLLWHIHTLDRDHAFLLRNKCYEEYFSSLDISENHEDYFYNIDEYKMMTDIMDGDVKISVIVPVYNTQEYLLACLESITSQTLHNIEIICVDDKSEDNSVRIIKDFIKKDPRIFLVECDNNYGSGYCRNIAIKIAHGKYIAFMDSDDWYPDNNVLEDLYSAAEANGALICGGSFSRFIDGVLSTEFEERFKKYSFEYEGFIDYKDYQFDYGYTRFIYNRGFLKNNNLYFPDYKRFQDPPFMSKVFSEAKSFYALPRLTYVYRKLRKEKKIWTREALNDNILGITEEIIRSKEKGLNDLHYISYNRLNTEYYKLIKDKLESNDDEEEIESTRKLLLDAEEALDAEILSAYLTTRKNKYPLRALHPAEFDNNGNVQDVCVSVIIPVYNGETFIRQCLDSICRQTLRQIEIICVNDGSTDDTHWILSELAKADSRIRVIEKEHSNAGDARNIGKEEAVGEYLSFLDADDFFEPTMLELAYNKAKEDNADVVLFRSNQYIHDKDEYRDTPWTLRDWEMPEYRPFAATDVKDKIFNMSSCTAWDKLFKRDFIENNNIVFQSNYASNDMLFTFAALSTAERISTLNDVLAHQRVGHTKKRAKDIEYITSCYYYALMALKNRLVERNVYHIFQKSYVNWALDFSLFNMHIFKNPFSDLIKQQLKLRYFEDMDVLSLPEEDFYNYDQYVELQQIISERPEQMSDENPKVSVIMPIYNVSQYLRLALDSAVYQTMENIEIICVNDGSTDDCLEIIKEYAERDSRIKVITGENHGYGYAMNRGLEAATGEYIGIIEPDDFVDVNMFNDLYDIAKSNTLDFVKGDFYRFKHNQNGDLTLYLNQIAAFDNNYDEIYAPANNSNWLKYIMNTWCGIYNREWLLANGIDHNETPGASYQDNGFFFKTHIFSYRSMNIRRPYYLNRRDNPNSSVYAKDKLQATDREFRLVEDYLKEGNYIENNLTRISQQKLIGHFATLHRASNSYKKEYLYGIADDTALLLKEGMIKRDTLSLRHFKWAQRISADVEEFYYHAVRYGLAVSVIVTMSDNNRYLRRCLSSILNQSYKNIELICISDTASAIAKDIIEEYRSGDDRLIVIEQKDQNKSLAIYNAVKIASGEYVLCIESDEYIDRNLLEIGIADMKKYRADICFFRSDDDQTTDLYVSSRNNLGGRCYSYRDMPENIFEYTIKPSSHVLIRHDIIEQNIIDNNERLPVFDNLTIFKCTLNSSRIVMCDTWFHNNGLANKGNMPITSFFTCHSELLAIRSYIEKKGLMEFYEKEYRKYALNRIITTYEGLSSQLRQDYCGFLCKSGFSAYGISDKVQTEIDDENSYSEYIRIKRMNEKKDMPYLLSIIIPINTSVHLEFIQSIIDCIGSNIEIISLIQKEDTSIGCSLEKYVRLYPFFKVVYADRYEKDDILCAIQNALQYCEGKYIHVLRPELVVDHDKLIYSIKIMEDEELDLLLTNTPIDIRNSTDEEIKYIDLFKNLDVRSKTYCGSEIVREFSNVESSILPFCEMLCRKDMLESYMNRTLKVTTSEAKLVSFVASCNRIKVLTESFLRLVSTNDIFSKKINNRDHIEGLLNSIQVADEILSEIDYMDNKSMKHQAFKCYFEKCISVIKDKYEFMTDEEKEKVKNNIPESCLNLFKIALI